MLRIRAIALLLALVAGGCSGDDTESVCIQLDTSNRHTYIRDYQYVRYRIFDIAKIGGVEYLAPGDTITRFFLFQSAGSLSPELPEGVAYPNSLEPTSSPDSVVQRFRELAFGYDYELLMGIDAGQYTLFFSSPLQNVATTTIVYHMVVKKSDGSTLAFGDVTGPKFRLQIVKRANPQPADPLWDAEWKNVYTANGGASNLESQRADIFRGILGDEANPANLNHQNGVPFLSLLGLDSFYASGQYGHDNQIDWQRFTLGLEGHDVFTFPSRYPFADSVLLQHFTPSLYSTLDSNDLRDSSKYYFRFRDESFDLGYENIVSGSTRIQVNGSELTENHGVETGHGILHIWDESVYVEGADVEVCFDYWK